MKTIVIMQDLIKGSIFWDIGPFKVFSDDFSQ